MRDVSSTSSLLLVETPGTSANVDTYFDRMLSSLGDKKRILEHLPPVNKSSTKNSARGDDEKVLEQRRPLVVDVGCGDGALTAAISAHGYQAVGIDSSESSLRRCAENGVIAYPGRAHELGTVLTDAGIVAGTVDAFVCSAVIHEVFSYGREGRSSLGEVDQMFAAMYTMLAPGGVIIVRDGIDAGDDHCVIAVDDVSTVERFLDESPFSVRTGASEGKKRSIELTHLWGNLYEGTRSSCAEFAFTYTWGMTSWAREIHELYGVFSEAGMKTLAASHALSPVFFEEYVQPGYRAALAEKVQFVDSAFPSTNAVWTFEKV